MTTTKKELTNILDKFKNQSVNEFLNYLKIKKELETPIKLSSQKISPQPLILDNLYFLNLK